MAQPSALEPTILPAEALLGLVFAAERLGATSVPAKEAYRVASATSQVFALEEVAGLAADCGLSARATVRDHSVGQSEILLAIEEGSRRPLVFELGEDGVVTARKLVADGSQIRSEVVDSPRHAPDAGMLLLWHRPDASEDQPKPQQHFSLNWFWQRVKGHPGEVRMVLFAAAVIHVIALATPLIFAALVDRVLPNEEKSTLLALVLIAAVTIGMGFVLSVQRDRKIAWVAARVDARTSAETFRHLLSLPLSYFNSAKAGVVARNLKLNEDIREFITGPATEAVIKLAALPIALTVLLYLSMWLTLIVLVAGLALAAVLWRAWGPYRKELRRVTELEGRRQALAVETIHGAATVKALAIGPAILGEWKPLSQEIAASHETLANNGARARARMQAIERFTDLLIIAVGIYLVMNGQLTVGALIAFKLIADQVIDPMVHAAGLAQEWQTNKRQVELLGEIMTAAPEIGAPNEAPLVAPRLTGSFAFKSVTFRYPNASRPAVEDFMLEVPTPGPRGMMIAIVGESGSGKSTITKLLLGLYRPDQGNIDFGVSSQVDVQEGRIDSRAVHPEALRRTLSIVAQDNQFFAGTIRRNLQMPLLGRAHRESDIQMALVLSCAADFIAALPDGLDTQIEENAANLSGGQRQRLSIARALLRNPPILILDEATSALDVETELAFRRNMRAFAANRTLVTVAHRLNTIRDADLIVVMQEGRIVESGTHDELMVAAAKGEPEDGAAGLYARMWRAQMGETTEP